MSNAAEGSPASGRAPRIAVVTPHLGLGGAQRVVTHITGYWVDRGYDVTVITVLDDPPDFYRLSPGVKRVRLPEPVVPFVRLRRFLVRLIERRELLADLPAAERARAAISGPAPAAGSAPGGGGAGGTAAGGSAGKPERRRLDFLRAVYRLLERMRDASVFPVAKYRLFGRSVDRYARFLRAADQQTKALHILLTRIGADVVLSMLGTSNIMSVAASAGLPHRTVISERNDPSKQRLDPPWDHLRPLLYPGADAVSANSRGALDAMRAYCPAEKLCLAPNPLVLPSARAGAARSSALLFLARLVPQKAPDILIEAFARFHRDDPEWALHLAGDGPLAERLEERVRALGLAGSVTFHGTVADPAPLLSRCRIFVLPSRFEGTPNALLEAMAHRMSCIVSDASPGPLRLIEDGVTGLVVETGSVSALAAAMARLARDERLRQELGDAALDRVRDFSLDRVGPVWDRILFPAGGESPR